MKKLPRDTGLYCPDCKNEVCEEEWVQTQADHEGNPYETTGTGFYCKNTDCDNNLLAIDEDFLLESPTEE